MQPPTGSKRGVESSSCVADSSIHVCTGCLGDHHHSPLELLLLLPGVASAAHVTAAAAAATFQGLSQLNRVRRLHLGLVLFLAAPAQPCYTCSSNFLPSYLIPLTLTYPAKKSPGRQDHGCNDGGGCRPDVYVVALQKVKRYMQRDIRGGSSHQWHTSLTIQTDSLDHGTTLLIF